MAILRATIGNTLLSGMSESDYALLEPHLTRIALPRLLDFYDAGGDIGHVYFPEDGIVSIVATEADGHQVEVGIFGREGMAGTPIVLATDCSPHHVYIQVEGVSGLKLETVLLREAMQASPTLSARLLRYVQTVLVQTASSLSARASYTIEQRLARWILMCDDRLSGDIRLTHELMSMMLGSRRASVTVAVQNLEMKRLITTKRGSTTVRDRTGLEKMTGGCYGYAEAEYERIMGFAIHTASASPSAGGHRSMEAE